MTGPILIDPTHGARLIIRQAKSQAPIVDHRQSIQQTSEDSNCELAKKGVTTQLKSKWGMIFVLHFAVFIHYKSIFKGVNKNKSQHQWYTITYLLSHSGKWNKRWNGVFFPTKHVIPKSLKVGQWLSQVSRLSIGSTRDPLQYHWQLLSIKH